VDPHQNVTDPQHWFQAKQLETRALSPIQVSVDIDGFIAEFEALAQALKFGAQVKVYATDR
jgi:hypothetical protein